MRMRFWSMPPPRTLNPVDPSLGVWTPGIIWITRMMSFSPISVGIFFTRAASTRCRPICGNWISSRLDREKIVAASSSLRSTFIWKSIRVAFCRSAWASSVS